MTTAYLTVDDAPSADLPAKLAVLAEQDVPAAFFCEGRRLEDHPEHAREAVEAGFHLGNHLATHPYASEIESERFRAELERTEELLEDVYDRAGVERPARLFRFPYGDRGGDRADAFQAVLAERGFVPPTPGAFEYEWYADDHAGHRDWAWTVALDDWNVETAGELRERVEAATDRIESDSADVVLFHDAGNSPELFEVLASLLRDRGVRFGDPLALVDGRGT